MSDIVNSVSINQLLTKLRDGEWLIPQFQRDFVWSIADVEALVGSIFEARPIGMATLWEQADNSGLDLAHVSLADTAQGTRTEAYFGDPDAQTNRRYAILDGRQRCTAIAMAFGGLRPNYGNRKGSGRFFLNLAANQPTDRVEFVRTSRIKGRGLDTVAGCLSQGYVPLELDRDKTITTVWFGYIEKLSDDAIYPDGTLPSEEELAARKLTLSDAFEGLTNTELAVYTVPPTYDLGDICEIFETLNTTGTKVSTVDLVHAWLYQETQDRAGGPILLREWLSELGQTDGGVGWSSPDERPELVAQVVTASHVASAQKAEPRRVSGKVTKITSVKAGDLLSTPSLHWERAVENTELLASWFEDFQHVVGEGRFSARDCPYPASAGIYVGLRWAKYFDPDSAHPWSIDRLGSLYRAFFWRNTLTSRYDQGFLTQIGADIKALDEILSAGVPLSNDKDWAELADSRLLGVINKTPPSEEDLANWANDGSTAGAMRLALRLPMIAKARADLVDSQLSIEYPSSGEVELHHIFPRKWCMSNRVGELRVLLAEQDETGKDWINAASNLMPLSKKSNQQWMAKVPGQVFAERGIDYRLRSDDFERAFIDEQAFDLLSSDHQSADHTDAADFWRHRGRLIARYLHSRMQIRLP